MDKVLYTSSVLNWKSKCTTFEYIHLSPFYYSQVAEW